MRYSVYLPILAHEVGSHPVFEFPEASGIASLRSLSLQTDNMVYDPDSLDDSGPGLDVITLLPNVMSYQVVTLAAIEGFFMISDRVEYAQIPHSTFFYTLSSPQLSQTNKPHHHKSNVIR